MNNRKLSPFMQLLRVVESELYDLSLQMQYTGSKNYNPEFVLGYRCALNVILERAYAIYNRRYPDGIGALDEREESATEYLLRIIKKGS
jgi:hypothetical protein